MTDGRPQYSESPDRANGRRTASPQVPAAARKGSRWVPLTLAVSLCAVVAGVSAAVLLSSSGRPAGNIVGGSSSRAAATNSAAQPTASGASGRTATRTALGRTATRTEVTNDGIAKSALRWPPRLKDQIRRWEAGPGGVALTAVEQQLGNAAQAAGIKLYAPARQACSGLASDIRMAQAGPPIPYNPMQQLYARALSGLSRAAVHCRTAISVHASGDEGLSIQLDHALLSRSQVEFAAASKKLYGATAEIQSLRR
jgi:hypothetical protein